MKRTKQIHSTPSTILYTTLISLFITTSLSLNLHRICNSSCGEIETITYPFRLNSDHPSCNDPDYELSCVNNKTILYFNEGKFLVKNISYPNNTIRVVDYNFAEESCKFPSGKIQSRDVFDSDFNYWPTKLVLHSYVAFVNCSTNISHQDFITVPCLTSNSSFVYAIYFPDEYYSMVKLNKSCKQISMALGDYHKDAKFASYEDLLKLLRSGFDLQWSVLCRNCLLDGKQCAITGSENKPYDLICFDDYQGIRYTFPYHIELPENKYTELYIITICIMFSFIALVLSCKCVCAPLTIFVFLIHKYRTTRKGEDGSYSMTETEGRDEMREQNTNELEMPAIYISSEEIQPESSTTLLISKSMDRS